MLRALPLLVGLTVLGTAGLVHGLWTDRWRSAADLLEARDLVAELPADIGAWKGEEVEQDPDALEMAGAIGHYSRTFLDPKTGEKVLVILLVGKAARMAVHRPEHCYTAAGYELKSKPTEVQVTPPDSEPAELGTALFGRDEATGPSVLRIFWSYGTTQRWSAPANPRWQFARERVLYKLYVIRSIAGQPGLIRDDPCVRFFGEFLPVLERTLSIG